MEFQKLIISILLLLATLLAGTQRAFVADNISADPKFVLGAQVDLHDPELNLALNLAEGMEMNWIAVDLDWAVAWPDPSQKPDLAQVLNAVELAGQKELQVLLVLSNPPAWAMGENGPDAQKTSKLLQAVVSSSSNALAAVELFPGANTVQGWKSVPDARRYWQLLGEVQASLSVTNPALLVIPSLQPLEPGEASDGIDDLVFLDELYEFDGMQDTPAIALRFSQVHGQPLTAPALDQQVVLRHYELLRRVMLDHNHKSGKIWITSFSWPLDLGNYQEQATWVYQAFEQLRAQPFIAAAFFTSLNARSISESPSSPASLLLPVYRLHPAAKLIAQLNAVHTVIINQ